MAKKIYRDFTLKCIKKHFTALDKLVSSGTWTLKNLEILSLSMATLQRNIEDAKERCKARIAAADGQAKAANNDA